MLLTAALLPLVVGCSGDGMVEPDDDLIADQTDRHPQGADYTLGAATASAHVPWENEGWTPLFNGTNLTGWYTWLPSTGIDSDPKGVFKVENGMLHILGIPVTRDVQEFGYVSTTDDYRNYRLRLQYKWGTKRFPPRATKKRDSGLLYSVVGSDAIWPISVESQIQENDTGDIWLLGNTTLSTTVADLSVKVKRYKDNGFSYTQTKGRIRKHGIHDQLREWNNIELFAFEDASAHMVNGVINNRGWNIMREDPSYRGGNNVLDAGRIALQAEGAEVFYRNIEIMQFEYTPPPDDAIVLFDGSDTSAWKRAADGGGVQWPIVDGALEVCTTCGSIVSRDRFSDFRLHIEFKIPIVKNSDEQKRGNSGIYLQSRYEVQILDSFGRSISGRNDAGAIYGVKNPSSNASLPAMIWQSYDIVFTSPRWNGDAKVEHARASVWFNGILVQDETEIPKSTVGGRSEKPRPGPIMLQDHDNKVQFRNIWIQPLGTP